MKTCSIYYIIHSITLKFTKSDPLWSFFFNRVNSVRLYGAKLWGYILWSQQIIQALIQRYHPPGSQVRAFRNQKFQVTRKSKVSEYCPYLEEYSQIFLIDTSKRKRCIDLRDFMFFWREMTYIQCKRTTLSQPQHFPDPTQMITVMLLWYNNL